MRWRAVVGGLLLLLCAASCARPVNQKSKVASRAADSADGGRSNGMAQAVRVSAEKTEAAEPAAASGLDGSVYVAWVEHRGGKEADVWLSRFDGEEKPLGVPVRVNPDAGRATAWRGDPPTIAVSTDGTIYVGWTARDEGAAHASTLYLSASRDGGRSFEPPSRVNDDPKPGVHGMHSLAVSGDGRVYVAWLDERNVAPKPAPANAPSHMHTESNREVFFAFSADGGRTFSPNVRVASEVCPCCKTSLAVAGDGRVYVGWRQVLPGDYRHIAVASTADGGQTFSSTVVVSDDGWQIAGCPVSGAALSVGADNALRVLWYTAGEAGSPGLYWSESRDGGRTFSPRRALAETGGRGTPILLKGVGDGFTAVWEDSDGTSPAALTAGLTADGRVSAPSIMASGSELPAAVEAGGQLFIAYIGGGEEDHAVWLTRAASAADSRVALQK